MLKYLITLLAFLLVTGLLWPLLSRFGLGRLPGDSIFASRDRRFVFPFTSSLILSLAATLLFGWLW
jgi:hypothetical protein